jgi:rhodanese-related sulfurtransferase
MQRTFKIALAIFSLALFATLARAANDEAYPDISIKDLKAAIADKSVTVIDANGNESYTEGHIPGAINFASSAEKLSEKLPKDKSALVVAYCGGPQCMAYKAAAAKAKELGYTNVKHLSAGISGWKDAGEKTEK